MLTHEQNLALENLILWHDLKMKKCLVSANQEEINLEEVKNVNSVNYRERKQRIKNFIRESNFHLNSFRLLVIMQDKLK